jgi:putative DNA methylase
MLQRGNIAPVDLAQSAIGPGIGIFSRFTKVLETDGAPMRVRTALALINQALDEILAEHDSEFDPDTRWAIAWYEQFGLSDSDFGTADVLARAKNTSVAGLVEAGIASSGRRRVRLLRRTEYSVAWDPAKDRRIPVWEATQRLVQVLLTDGEEASATLLLRMGGLGETARDLGYRLHQVATQRGWTDEARAYNALVVAWSDLARTAGAENVSLPAQGTLGLPQ